MWNWNKFVPIIFVIGLLNAQTISTIDTVLVAKDQHTIQLEPYIIENSLYIFHNGSLFNDFKLDHIEGILQLISTFDREEILHVSYSYLQNNPPKVVGPLYLSLPKIDSLVINSEINEGKELQSYSMSSKEVSNLATTGTIYRNLSLSQAGGSDFSGGLQLQLQGQLTNDIFVSGILSDQSIPIQPEGNTQSIEEIDKVYLHVKHPIFQIMAGDIDYSVNSGKYLNISRKLEGLRGTIDTEKWKAQGTLSSSRGRYRKTDFKGIDGNQGPYQLSSESGSRDIIVLAGTEKVYVNGELRKRGENFDYTIDYSIGEITFTPKVLIDFDTDIYVEYEYSDYQYSRNVIGNSIERDLGKWGRIGFAWLKERDQLQSSTGISDILDSLKNAGDSNVIISGAKSDETGDYIFSDGIYIYSPNSNDDQRYSVSFQNNNELGNYARKISEQGEIYYEYIVDASKVDDIDYYSPFTTYTNPVDHQLFQITGDINTSESAKVKWDVSLSDLDKNVYSNIDDEDNLGVAYNLELIGNRDNIIRDLDIGYNFTNWNRSKTFNEISKERDPLFNREWNVDEVIKGQESMFTGGLNVNYNEVIKSYSELSNYLFNNKNRQKYFSQLSAKTKLVPIFNAKINRVQNNRSDFYQFSLNTELLPGFFNPMLNYSGEYKSHEYRFDISKIGFQYKKNKNNISASVAKRNDFASNEIDSTKMELIKENIYGEIAVSGNIKKSFFVDIIFKKRFSDNFRTNNSQNYSVGSAKLRFVDKNSPIRWELLSKLEEALTESRAVVYDSVGVGLGSYRFDEVFNEYIADPNGDYISYSVLTGERELATHFTGSQRLQIDFGKTNIELLKNIDFRSDFKNEFRGNTINFENVFNPNISNENIISSKINFRNEIDYNSKNRFIRNWYLLIRNLNGNDPRGNDLKNQIQYGIEWREKLINDLNSYLDFEYHEYDYSSSFSDLRNRNVYGWWAEEQLKWKIKRKWQFVIALVGGIDNGYHNEEDFNAYSYGINLEGQRFLRSTTSIKFKLDLNNSISRNNILPPEALNGLPIGSSISLNINGHILLGKNLSLNTSINYVDNSRYDNFITISGELRAYF